MTLNNQIGQQKFTFILHKSQARPSGLCHLIALLGMARLPKLTSWSKMTSETPLSHAHSGQQEGREEGAQPFLKGHFPEVAHTFATLTSLARRSHMAKPGKSCLPSGSHMPSHNSTTTGEGHRGPCRQPGVMGQGWACALRPERPGFFHSLLLWARPLSIRTFIHKQRRGTLVR